MVEIVRMCDRDGRYYREIRVRTELTCVDKSNCKFFISYITDRLLSDRDYLVSKFFDTFTEAEEWVEKRIEEVKMNRQKILDNKEKELPSERIIIL